MEYVEEKKVNAKFTSFVPYEDLKALYLACDIFVLLSLEEGFGVVLTGALASGKPLIGSSVGGIFMQIRSGWNGFLVEPANEKQLADKIKYLMDNEKELYKFLSKNFEIYHITGNGKLKRYGSEKLSERIERNIYCRKG
ncbi:MAG: glycosyltransferase [Nitrososphaerota archaeon]|nr:glycosyltransferase [Nitrososphaerota archaeon]